MINRYYETKGNLMCVIFFITCIYVSLLKKSSLILEKGEQSCNNNARTRWTDLPQIMIGNTVEPLNWFENSELNGLTFKRKLKAKLGVQASM